MTSGPYTPEFFARDLAPSYASAKRIVPQVLSLVPACSVLDVGCGKGDFLRAFREAGVGEILGIDGDHVPRDQLVIGPDCFRPLDLANAFDLGRRYDLVVSLEVAEHLPPECADAFVETLVRHGPIVLFSAAVPLQSGTGHINEQWPTYWAERFDQHGCQPYDVVRPLIWQDEGVAWWYRQNVLLFATAEGRARCPGIADLEPTPAAALDRVHPDNYLRLAQTAQSLTEQLGRLNDYFATGSLFEVQRSPDGKTVITRR